MGLKKIVGFKREVTIGDTLQCGVQILLICGPVFGMIIFGVNRTTEEVKDSLTKQHRQTTSEIKDSLTKQNEQTASEIKDRLTEQTEQINVKMQEVFSDFGSVVTLKEGDVNVFKYDLSSSFTVAAIDPEQREVTVQSNIKGDLQNVILVVGRTWIVPMPQGHTYTVILTGIDVTQGDRTAKFVIAKE